MTHPSLPNSSSSSSDIPSLPSGNAFQGRQAELHSGKTVPREFEVVRRRQLNFSGRTSLLFCDDQIGSAVPPESGAQPAQPTSRAER